MSSNAILTVALNAAVDVAYVVDDFSVGKINIVREMSRMAGGKANNVARVLASLGHKVIATGFVGGGAGRFIQEDLARLSITPDFEATAGENRTCTAIVDPKGNTLTEVREKGPILTQANVDRFMDRFRHLVRQVELVIISGSLPPGVDPSIYRELVAEAYQGAQVRTIVDASGKAFKETLAAQPYLVKPNMDELEEWVGHTLATEAEVLTAARSLIEVGPLVVAVSMGARGLLLVSPEGAWRATPPVVVPVNTVGSGDSLVAGFAAGLTEGLPAEEVLRLAVACGTANALTTGVAVVHGHDLDRIRPDVTVERLA